MLIGVILLVLVTINTVSSFVKNSRINYYTVNKLLLTKESSVDELIETIRNRDTMSTKEDNTFNNIMYEWIDHNSAVYLQNNTAKNDMNLYGNYNVSFVGTGKDQRNQGNPAGGGYRGTLGKLFFDTKYLFQNIVSGQDNKNTYVINVVKGNMFKFIPFCVILVGVIRFLNEFERNTVFNKYGNPLSNSTVKAQFNPPLLCFGSVKHPWSFLFKIGPNSSVVLDTPYVDPKIRLGKGSRGSYFVFIRNTDNIAEEYKYWIQKKPVNAFKVGFLMTLFSMLFHLSWLSIQLPAKLFQLLKMTRTSVTYPTYWISFLNKIPNNSIVKTFSVIFFLFGVLLMTSSGGIVDEDMDDDLNIA